jgi:hypothetical protein
MAAKMPGDSSEDIHLMTDKMSDIQSPAFCGRKIKSDLRTKKENPYESIIN